MRKYDKINNELSKYFYKMCCDSGHISTYSIWLPHLEFLNTHKMTIYDQSRLELILDNAAYQFLCSTLGQKVVHPLESSLIGRHVIFQADPIAQCLHN